MLKSLQLISSVKRLKDIPLKERWIMYLKYTSEKSYNLRNVEDLASVSTKSVLKYTIRTLKALEKYCEENDEGLTSKEIEIVEEVLKWSEVSKCGAKAIREKWQKKGYDLFVHNLASAEIYQDDVFPSNNKLTYVLIQTHGMIGQYVKGEVNLDKNKPLTQLVFDGVITKERLEKILRVLNRCVLEGVSTELYQKVAEDINITIEKIVNGEYPSENYEEADYIFSRMKKIFHEKSEEDFSYLSEKLMNKGIREAIGYVFRNFELWYVDSALEHFSIEEILKIFLIVSRNAEIGKNVHINFEPIMTDVYYMYKGIKVKHLYKLRIIESYLESMSFEEILKNKIKKNEHIWIRMRSIFHTLRVGFKFSLPAQKLIEFCEVAYGSNDVYHQAVFMLYDLFGFRRDAYDRFYEEMNYLSTMNSSINHKAIILNYITGKTILDVGPGGGALLDLIESSGKAERVIGIDVSHNVIEELKRKKNAENKKWEIVQGDALQLKNYFKKGEIDTIIFCSVLHELFSYIETDGKKFNHKTLEMVIQSCFDVLPKGGRIIIRDGIMSEKNPKRLIRFKNIEDMKFLERYCKDFKGRDITYEVLDSTTVQMDENDAMEFLYTYTWGEESYPLEVQEQFGYYTPTQYVEMIKKIGDCKVVECKHFLQEGYEEHLFEKIEFYDTFWEKAKLPDSTCILVIEKK